MLLTWFHEENSVRNICPVGYVFDVWLPEVRLLKFDLFMLFMNDFNIRRYLVVSGKTVVKTVLII